MKPNQVVCISLIDCYSGCADCEKIVRQTFGEGVCP